MRPISYMSRLYVPPPIDPDDAGPIATKVSHRDIALVASKNAAGQYIYSQSVDIQVATARPIEIPAASSQTTRPRGRRTTTVVRCSVYAGN